ncbi:hypothetical protein [Priestia megaterium]|uniref:hypothetical protein n=1 Tax=Priestia megaterium TaxID=1404 RepID=UPI0031FD17DE
MEKCTCPYCGNEVEAPMMQGDKCYCNFCETFVTCSKGGKRKSRFQIRHVGLECMNMNLPELMELHTYDLLLALRTAREERRSYYGLMSSIKKAASQSQEFIEPSVNAGDEYEKATGKVRQIENILLERVGYIPTQVTEHLLLKYIEKCTDPINKSVMNIKKVMV